MWKCIRCTAALTVALVGWMPNDALLFGQTQLISSFENNFSSTVGATWEGPGIANSEFVTTGATDGTHALAIHHDPNWNIQLILKGGMPLAQATASHDFLLIDATTTDPGVGGDGRFINWRAIVDVFNSNQGGWQQTQLDIHPVAADDGGSATTTLILDLTQPQGTNPSIKQNAQAFVDAGGGDGTYWELFLPMLGGDRGHSHQGGRLWPSERPGQCCRLRHMAQESRRFDIDERDSLAGYRGPSGLRRMEKSFWYQLFAYHDYHRQRSLRECWFRSRRTSGLRGAGTVECGVGDGCGAGDGLDSPEA